MPHQSESREKKRKAALRSRVLVLASALLCVTVVVAARTESVAAAGPKTHAAKVLNASTNPATTDGATASPTGASARAGDSPDKAAGDAVGTIEGDAIALQGPMTVEVVRGQVRTMLRSGNDIRVKSGQARIDLVEGGTIAICGPAHLSLLKSGGSLTIAVDSGVVHVHVDTAPRVTIYTAQLQAKPIAIGDSPQDVLIGFDATGVMCVRAGSGAVRLEHQLSGQSIVVPQGGDILLNGTGLEGITNTAGHCECEMQVGNEPPPQPELSRMATPDEIRQRDAAKAAEAAAVKEAADNAAMDKAAAEKEAADRAAAERAATERAAAEKAAADKLAADQAIASKAAAHKAAADKAAADRAAAERLAAAQAAAARAAADQAAVQTPPSVIPTATAENNTKPPVPWGENASPQVEPKVVRPPALPKNQEPIYQVFMPPMTFDAKAAAPADNFDPKFIMLVRRVRVKPTLIYQGRVEGDTPEAKQVSDVKPVNPAAPQGTQQNAKPAPPPDTSVVNRVRNYIRHLFS